MTTRILRLTALGVAVMMLFATPGVALAQETDETRPADATTDEVQPADRVTDRRDQACRALKERALHAIQQQVAAINRMQEAVSSNGHLTRSHKAQLQAELTAAQRGLTHKAEAIAGASCRELPEIVRRLVDDHRVLALLVPKVHLVIGADTMLHIIGRFEGVAEGLQGAINRFGAAGYDVSAPQAELEEMKTQLRSAFALAEPVPGMVLPLKPEDLPEAASIIEEAARMLRGAAGEVRAAWQSAHEVVQALRQIKDS